MYESVPLAFHTWQTNEVEVMNPRSMRNFELAAGTNSLSDPTPKWMLIFEAAFTFGMSKDTL